MDKDIGTASRKYTVGNIGNGFGVLLSARNDGAGVVLIQAQQVEAARKAAPIRMDVDANALDAVTGTTDEERGT